MTRHKRPRKAKPAALTQTEYSRRPYDHKMCEWQRKSGKYDWTAWVLVGVLDGMEIKL